MSNWNDPNGPYSQNAQRAEQAALEARQREQWAHQSRMQAIHDQNQRNLSVSGRSGGGSRGSSASGNDTVADGFFEMGHWFVMHIWPLKVLLAASKRMMAARWRMRMSIACMGSIFLGVLVAGPESETAAWPWGHDVLYGFTGPYALWVALGLGGFTGWFAPDIVGLSVGLIVMLLGMAVGLAVIAAALMLVYLVIASVAEWPPFEASSAAGAEGVGLSSYTDAERSESGRSKSRPGF